MLYAVALRVMLATVNVEGLALEGIVTVKSSTGQPHKDRRRKIRRQHERAPAFVLGNVHGLVFAGNIE